MTINALNIIPTRTASCPLMGDYAIAKKMNVKWGNAKRGDIVLFDFNRNGTSDHIGIVTKVTSTRIYTIEGNTDSENQTNGDGVYRRARTKSVVNYFIRPKYNSEVTAEMIVKTAESQVGYKEGKNNDTKYGKWMGANHQPWCASFVCWVFAHVSAPEIIKAIAKPTGKYTGAIPAPTIKKGSKGTKVKDLQRFLNWYSSFKLVIDGDCGVKTVKAMKVFQKTEGLTADGIYGKKSQAKAKIYKAATSKPKVETAAKPTASSGTSKADKIVAKIKELAWPEGTAKKKYSYKTKSGRPTDKMKAIMRKRGYDSRVEYSDCGYCVNSVLHAALEIKVKVLAGNKEPFPSLPQFSVVHSGKKIPSGVLRPGDIIRYKKKTGSQHVLFYIGNNDIAEGGRKIRFFVIKHFAQLSKAKFNKSNVKYSRLQVLRIKE